MKGKARGSPAARGVTDIQDRVARLDEFVSWENVSRLSFENMSRTICGVIIEASSGRDGRDTCGAAESYASAPAHHGIQTGGIKTSVDRLGSHPPLEAKC
jgi:hypothetical protein